MRPYGFRAKQLPSGMIVPDCPWIVRWAMHHVSCALFRSPLRWGWAVSLYGYWGYSHKPNYGWEVKP